MKSNIIRRYRRKLRRVQLNFRRMNFTLIGDEGKPWRRAIAIAAGVLLLVVAVIFGRAETQLMSSAEVKTVQERGVLRIGVIPDMPGAELEKELGRRIAAKLLPDADPESRIDFRDVGTIGEISSVYTNSSRAQYFVTTDVYKKKIESAAELDKTTSIVFDASAKSVRAFEELIRCGVKKEPELTD